MSVVSNWKENLARPSPVLVFVILALVVLVFFSPILPTYFLADDYNYVGHLLVNARQYVQGEQLGKWFIDFSAQGLQNPELSVFFRPVVQWLWLTDYIAWNTDAFGYHLTNILLHGLNAFLVYLLATQVLRDRWGALAAGLLFALHPIHAESVAWIADRTDVLSTFFYFGSAVFFVLYRRRARGLYGAISVIAFALAIGTKENTVALPVVLLIYDFIYTFRTRRWHILWAQVPYWLVLAGYVGARFLFLGQFGRNTGGGFLSYGTELFLQFYAQSLAQPFVGDLDNRLWIILFVVAAVILFVYRKRAAVWFGFAWVAVSLLPATSTAYVAPRLTYAPSAGLALALAAIVMQPFPGFPRRSRAASIGLLAVVLAAYGWGLAARIDNWAAAGAVANAVRTETLRLHPTLPPDARLVYTGVPDLLRGIYIYNDNFPTAIQIAYGNSNLAVARGDKFPILSDNLDRTFFLEYNRRKITARVDLVHALQARRQCLSVSAVGKQWDLSGENADWIASEQMTAPRVENGALAMRALSADAFLDSGALDIPALAIGDIEIEMRARADSTASQGALFWLTNGQTDFSSAQQQTFSAQADGAWHTYRIDLSRDGKLAMDDRIARLRLYPVQAPADIALKSIRVFVHCSQVEGVTCQCAQ